MGSIDYGIQKLSYDYNQEAAAKLFNNVTYNLAPRGIYSGYTLSKASDTSVIVSGGVCYIQDSINETGVRIESTSNYALTVSSTTPFIVFRFEWVDAKNNFMDYLALSYEDLLPEDIIVGRCVYAEDGTTLSSTFDYTRRTLNFLDKTKTQDSYLRVYPTEPASNKVSVTSGVLNSSSGNLVVSGGTYPVAGLAATTNGRIDLVYVTEEGLIDFIEGVDSSSPVAPRYGNRKVIAEIRRGAARTNIKGNEIFRVIGNFDVTPIVSDLLIDDTGSYYTSTNVEDALQELAGLGFTFVGDKVFNGSVTINASAGKVALKTKGVSGYNIEEARKEDNTLVQYTDQNGKFFNTVGIDAPLLDTYDVFTTDKYQEALNQLAGATFTFKDVKTFESSPLVPDNTFGDSSTKAANTKFVQDAIQGIGLPALGANWPTALASSAGAGILAQLLTVDGTNSGLDADKVRGTTPGAGGQSLLALTAALGAGWSTALAAAVNAGGRSLLGLSSLGTNWSTALAATIDSRMVSLINNASLTYSGTGSGIQVDNMTTGRGIYVYNASSGSGIYVENMNIGRGIYVYNAYSGQGVYVDNSAAGQGVHVVNSGTGYGVRVNNTGTGYGVYVNNSNNGYGLYVASGTGAGKHPAAKFTGNGIVFPYFDGGTTNYSSSLEAINALCPGLRENGQMWFIKWNSFYQGNTTTHCEAIVYVNGGWKRINLL